MAYSIIRDTGVRPVELGQLKAKDIDLESGEVYPTTAKHGAERVVRIKSSTLAMLKARAKSFVTIDIIFNVVLRGLKFQFGKKRSEKKFVLGP